MTHGWNSLVHPHAIVSNDRHDREMHKVCHQEEKGSEVDVVICREILGKKRQWKMFGLLRNVKLKMYNEKTTDTDTTNVNIYILVDIN